MIKVIFYCLLGFSWSLHSVLALKTKEKDLITAMVEKGYSDDALYNLRYTKEDLKDLLFKNAKAISEIKLNQYMLLKDDMHAFCGKMDCFRLLYPEGDLGFVGQFFAFYNAQTEYLYSSEERYGLLGQALKLTSCTIQEKIIRAKQRRISDFYKKLTYFSYDIVILDKLMETWLATKSLDEIKVILQNIMRNVPLLVLDISNHVSFDPKLYFDANSAVQVVPVRAEPGYSRTLYMVLMTGTEVGGKLYKGKMIRYKAKHNRMCWVCKHGVVKQYHKGHSESFSMVEKYRKSMKFYELCRAKNFAFIPEILFHEETSDRAFILMKNAGHQIKDIRASGEANQITAILDQVLAIFVHFEAEGITPEDIKANNFLIDASGNVSVIDYDNAVFTRGPRFKDFLRVLWGFTFEEKGSRQHVRNLLDRIQVDSYLEKFGPLLCMYIEPILEHKVETFAGLSQYRQRQSSVKSK